MNKPSLTVIQCLSTAEVLERAVEAHEALQDDVEGYLERATSLLKLVCMEIHNHIKYVEGK